MYPAAYYPTTSSPPYQYNPQYGPVHHPPPPLPQPQLPPQLPPQPIAAPPYYNPAPPPPNFMPHLQDSLDTLLQKLTALKHLIDRGENLAAATGYQAAVVRERDPERKVIAEMTPDEREYYTAWKSGTIKSLPAIDWTLNRGPTPTAPKPLKLAKRRAEALNRLYGTWQAEPAHSVWFTQNYILWLPLVKAVARIIGAEINAQGGQENINAEEWAELQTLGKIISVASQIMQKAPQGPQKKSVNAIIQLLIQRRAQITNRVNCPTKRRAEAGADSRPSSKRNRQESEQPSQSQPPTPPPQAVPPPMKTESPAPIPTASTQAAPDLTLPTRPAHSLPPRPSHLLPPRPAGPIPGLNLPKVE